MKKQLTAFKNLSRLPVINHGLSASAKSGRYNSLPRFEAKAIWEWITSYLRYAFVPRHKFLNASTAPNETSLYQAPDRLRISIAGDWGTGTEEAAAVAAQMMHWFDGGQTELTIHLGDVYYVGDDREVRENCLGVNTNGLSGVTWPLGELGSFALNGNHEMYANGAAYFDTFLPVLGMKNATGKASGQGPSFFCLENDYWRILGIDTGYNSVGLPILSLWFEGDSKLPQPLIDWLRDTVRPKEKPKATIILSHHQYFSAFEKNYPTPARQLAEFFDAPLIWLWGHEHRLAGYKYFGTDSIKVHGRCIGQGGMPIDATGPSGGNPLAKELLFYDARINPRYTADRLGFNGFAQLEFDRNRLKITYLSLATNEGNSGYLEEPRQLLTETFESDGTQIALKDFKPLCHDEGFVVAASAH